MKEWIKQKLHNLISKAKGAIDRGKKDVTTNIISTLPDFVAMLVVIAIRPAIAGYQGTEFLYYCALFSAVVLGAFLLLQVICGIGYGRIERLWKRLRLDVCKVRSLQKKAFLFFLIPFGAGLLIFVICSKYCKTECYVSVAEVFGLPEGVGEPLKENEAELLAGYWKIKNYPFAHKMTLTYETNYSQMDLIQQHSTLYNMMFFKPPVRVEYSYGKDRDNDKYRAYGQEYYLNMYDRHFKIPLEISYYSSSDKLLLQMERNDNGQFDIIAYSREDMPQLLNSTLFQLPKGETMERTTVSGIEVTYHSDGFPQSRRLIPHIYNQYGVNGEKYVYDENGKLTGLYYLDANGAPVCNKLGVMMTAFQYRENGNLQSIRYYGDEKGEKKTEGFHGVFCERFIYDDDGNLTERRQLDRDENWCYDDNEVYTYRYFYEAGALKGEEYLGFSGERIWVDNFRCQAAGFLEKKTAKGNVVEISFDSVGENGGNGVSFRLPYSQARTTGADRSGWDSGQQAITVSTLFAGTGSGTEERNGGREKKDRTDFGRNYAYIQYTLDGENRVFKETYRSEEHTSELQSLA